MTGSALKDMAYRNIALAVKPNGLTSVFQASRNQTNDAGYLMDNSEVYRGLRDFAAVLRERILLTRLTMIRLKKNRYRNSNLVQPCGQCFADG